MLSFEASINPKFKTNTWSKILSINFKNTLYCYNFCWSFKAKICSYIWRLQFNSKDYV